MAPAVEVRTLTKVYKGAVSRTAIRALDTVDLHVPAGEIFGLLGPNGAGKTTLIKILLSIVRPTQGTATLFGLPVTDPAARRRIGYLPENHRFPDFLTARQMLDLYGRLAGMPAVDRNRRIPLLLETVRMSKWIDTRIRKFSKGMMQRLGLAQALLNDADLIFLDEPTDGVDPVGRMEIRNLLVQLREDGKTIFLNSHLLSEVEQVCTRVAILNEGRLVKEGSIESLTAVDRIYEIRSTPIPDSLLTTFDAQILPQPHRTNADAPNADPTLGRYQILAKDRPHLNTILDTLRRHNVLLEEIRPVRKTLEAYFIDVIKDTA